MNYICKYTCVWCKVEMVKLSHKYTNSQIYVAPSAPQLSESYPNNNLPKPGVVVNSSVPPSFWS